MITQPIGQDPQPPNQWLDHLSNGWTTWAGAQPRRDCRWPHSWPLWPLVMWPLWWAACEYCVSTRGTHRPCTRALCEYCVWVRSCKTHTTTIWHWRSFTYVKVGDNLALTIFYILILTIRHYNGHTLVMGLFQMSFVATLAQVNIKVLDQFSFSHINHVVIVQNVAQHSLKE